MRAMKKFFGQTFVFLGISGAGKGTQSQRLQEYIEKGGFEVIYIYTGSLGRELAKKPTLIGHWIDDILKNKLFFPDFMPTALWFPVLAERLTDVSQVVIFDGTPRKLPEARVIEEIMDGTSRLTPVPIFLNIPEVEAFKRLSDKGGRKREDDTEEGVRSRLDEFNNYVKPILSSYGDRVVEVDGVGTTDEVFKRMIMALQKRL